MRLAAICLLAAGCATMTKVHLAMELDGVSAADKQRCVDAVRANGGIVDGGASLHALIRADASGNRLQLTSLSRGTVVDEQKPPGPIEPLCLEALAAASAASPREPLPETSSANAQSRSPTSQGSQ